MVSEQQQKAIRDFKMITEDEATLRKAAGVGIGLATAGISQHQAWPMAA